MSSALLVNLTPERMAREHMPPAGAELVAAVVTLPAVARAFPWSPLIAVGVGNLGEELDIRVCAAITLCGEHDPLADAEVVLTDPEGVKTDSYVQVFLDGFPPEPGEEPDPSVQVLRDQLAQMRPVAQRTPMRTIYLDSPSRSCGCGCDKTPSPGRAFLAGHDVKALRAMVAEHFGGSTTKALRDVKRAFGPQDASRKGMRPIERPAVVDAAVAGQW